MSGVNKAILIGNLGSDPEVRHLSNGSVVANFNIATSETYTNRNGERVTHTEWHRIELWDGLAKVAEQYLKKGNTVYIEGKIKTETWQDNDGNTRTTTRIRATNMTMLGGKASGDVSAAGVPPSSGVTEQPSGEQPSEGPAEMGGNETDDLPF